jgi:hypothetical protein
MAIDTFGFLTDQSTLMAVILGAVLATIGGFVATATERYLDKRERERNAALFFGEILSTLMVILAFADDTKKVGDPYGPITIRMLRSARRDRYLRSQSREPLLSGRFRTAHQDPDPDHPSGYSARRHHRSHARHRSAGASVEKRRTRRGPRGHRSPPHRRQSAARKRL